LKSPKKLFPNSFFGPPEGVAEGKEYNHDY